MNAGQGVPMGRIFTVGHSTCELEKFVESLKSHRSRCGRAVDAPQPPAAAVQ